MLPHIAIATILLLLASNCSAVNQQKQPLEVRLLVYSQSIGRGVPESASSAFVSIEKELRGAGYQPTVKVWGLEGEQRLCIVVSQSDLQSALIESVVARGEAVQLLRVEVSEKLDSCR